LIVQADDRTTPCRFRAVLFDFDGTLADTYPGITASVNHVRGLHGLAPLPEEEVRKHVGRGPPYLMTRTVPAGDVAENVARYKQHQPQVMRSGTRLFPGVAEALAALKDLGLLLAICSNKPRAFTVGLLHHFGMAARLDLVLGPEDVARPKPAPDMIVQALRRLKIARSEALYIGDMVVDIETARAAGVAVWVVPTGSDERETLAGSVPDRLLERLADLPALLRAGPLTSAPLPCRGEGQR
jgi:phosphoglycolate phosphatase